MRTLTDDERHYLLLPPGTPIAEHETVIADTLLERGLVSFLVEIDDEFGQIQCWRKNPIGELALRLDTAIRACT